MAGARDYSTTAASNLSVGGISIAEGWLPSAVNNAYRAGMADTASLLLDFGGGIATTGTAGAYAISLPSSPTNYADNLLFVARLNHAVAGASTINVSGLGVKDLKKQVNGSAVALGAGDGPIGHQAICIYSSADTAVLMLNPAVFPTATVSPTGGDDTALLTAAFAVNDIVRLYDPYGLGFNITGGCTVNARVLGNNCTINLLINGTTQRGLWMQSGSSLQDLVIVRTIDAVTPSSGSYGAAITSGEYDGTLECSNFSLQNIYINSVRTGGGASWNTISIMGNCHDWWAKNIVVVGDYLIPFLCHWGFTKSGGAEVTSTYHPRRFVIDNLHALNRSDPVDAGLALTTNSFGAYFSGCHDLTISNSLTRGGTTGFCAAIGDFGDERADADSVGRVMTNINFRSLTVENVDGEAILISGGATKVSYLAERWLGLNHNMNVSVDGLTVMRGNNSTSTTPGGYVQISHARNVHVRGLVGRRLTSTALPDNDAVVRFTNCVACSVQGETESGKGWLVESGCDLDLQPVVRCTSTTPTSTLDGITINGGAVNALVKTAVTAGATTINLDIPAHIYPGMLFQYGGYTFEFREGAMFDGTTAANNLGLTLNIHPAPIAIPDEATIELLTGGRRINVHDGLVAGFYNNMVQSSSDPRMPRDVRWENLRSDGSQEMDLEVEGGSGGGAYNCSFGRGNLTDGGASAQINLIAGSDFDVIGCEFNKDFRASHAYCVYRQTAFGPGGIVANNRFHAVDEGRASKAAIRLGAQNYPIDLIGSNYFGAGVSVRVLSTSFATKTTIGPADFIVDTGVQTTGHQRDGAYHFDADPAAAGAVMSVTTTEGSAPALGAVTGSVTNGSRDLTVNTLSTLEIGDTILIAGVTGAKLVVDIVGLHVWLDSASDATVAGAAVTRQAFTIKTAATAAA